MLGLPFVTAHYYYNIIGAFLSWEYFLSKLNMFHITHQEDYLAKSMCFQSRGYAVHEVGHFVDEICSWQ